MKQLPLPIAKDNMFSRRYSDGKVYFFLTMFTIPEAAGDRAFTEDGKNL
jgi:hypothetical protein